MICPWYREQCPFYHHIMVKNTELFFTSLKWSVTLGNMWNLWFLMNLRFVSRFQSLPSSASSYLLTFQKRMLSQVIIAFLCDFMLWDTVTPDSDTLIPRACCLGEKQTKKGDWLHRKCRVSQFLCFVQTKGKKRSKGENETILQRHLRLADSSQWANKCKSLLPGWERIVVADTQSGWFSANCIREPAWTSVSKCLFRINPLATRVCVCPWTCGWLRSGGNED